MRQDEMRAGIIFTPPGWDCVEVRVLSCGDAWGSDHTPNRYDPSLVCVAQWRFEWRMRVFQSLRPRDIRSIPNEEGLRLM